MTDGEKKAFQNGLIIGRVINGLIVGSSENDYEIYTGIVYGLVITTINSITLYESTQYE